MALAYVRLTKGRCGVDLLRTATLTGVYILSYYRYSLKVSECLSPSPTLIPEPFLELGKGKGPGIGWFIL